MANHPPTTATACESASKIPSELFDYIIDCNLSRSTVEAPFHSAISYLDRQFLATCGLVAKAWLPRSRYRLFENISLSPRNSDAFLKLLNAPSSTIASCVRSLSLLDGLGGSRPDQRLWIHQSISRLATLKGVENLWMGCVDLGVGLRDITQFLSELQSLNGIKLYDCGFRSPAGFVDMICACKNLTSLQLDSVTWLPTGQYALPDRGTMPAALRNIELRSCDQAGVLRWLIACNTKPRITTLRIAPQMFVNELPSIVELQA